MYPFLTRKLGNLKKLGSWELVKRPPGAARDIVGSKWALSIKKNAPETSDLSTHSTLTAYLNTVLGENEAIYLEQPAGYEIDDPRGWIWKLKKALYGLKQGS